MKRLTYLLFLLGVPLSIFGQDITTDLVGYWRFNGDLLDASILNNHATMSTPPFFADGANGEVNGAVVLNGSDQFLTIPDNADYAFGTGDFTFSAWVNYTSTGSTMCLMDKSIDNLGVCLFLDKDGAGRLTAHTKAGNEVLSTAANLNDGAWHHLVFIREVATSGETPMSILSIYIDGVLNRTVDVMEVDNTNNSAPILLAQSSLAPNGNSRYKGKIDDYRCYRRALSSQDISYLKQSHSSSPRNQYTYYKDNDRDGFGDPNNAINSNRNKPPSGYVGNNKDCNDNNKNINPDAAEICGNDVDENCDGKIEPAIGTLSSENVVQPTCNNPKGSITTTFSGLMSKSYRITLLDPVTGCSITSNYTFNAVTTPDKPQISVVQPTCTLQYGSITVTSPSSGVTYSFDNGSTFQTSNVKNNLTATTYYVKVKDNNSGCISDATSVVVNVGGNSVGIPILNITQPTCGNQYGSIKITSPTSGVSYSFDNGANYQSSNLRNNLSPGTYYVKIKDNVSGCISDAISVIINASSNTLNVPTYSITQPTCSNAFGTVTITSPLGSNYSYSFDGGVTFVASNVKSGLSPGTYRICFRDDNTGCISPEITITINPAPNNLNPPYVNIVHPNCLSATGSITVTSPSSGVTYSFDNGATYQTSNLKGGLSSGTYYVRVKDNSTGCVSNSTTAVITTIGNNLPIPILLIVQPTCSNGYGSITVTNYISGVSYSFDGGTTWGTNNSISGLLPGTYFVCTRDFATGCMSPEVEVIIKASGSLYGPYVSVVQPTCSNGFGAITVTSPTNGVSFSFDNGTSFQNSNTRTDLAPGTYYVRVRNNADGCVSSPTTVTISLGNTLNAPVVSVTQPSCSYPFGSIVVLSPASGVTYSFDGGRTFGTSNSIQGLVAGTYFICVRDNITGCISPEAKVNINNAPNALYAPYVTVYNAGCSSSTGSITVTNPSSGVTYSFDNGATFQASNVKTGLASGTYYVRVKENASGCVSGSTIAVISTGSLSAPVVSITQPTCSNAYGTLTFTSPLGNNYSYSFDGGATFGTSPTRTGLAPGTYRVCYRDNNGGCISPETTVVINPAYNTLNAPYVSVVQPSCGSSGSITVTSPTGSNYNYSFDNGVTYQSSNVRTGLGAGTYYVRVKDIYGSCVSSATTLTLSGGGSLNAPTLSITQPTCSYGFGTITVTSPISNNFSYSFDGGASFGSSNTRSGLLPGTYYVCVRDNYTGCISLEAIAVINNFNGSLNPPTVSVSQPSCSYGFGSITVTSPLGNNYSYSFDNGASYQSSNVRLSLIAGTYYVRVRDNSGTCVSNPTTVIISAPGTMFAPVLSVIQPTCSYAYGSITVTSPIGNNYSYSFDGGASFGSINVRTGLTPGTYRVCVRDNNTGCISPEATVVILGAPAGLATPTLSIVQPTCANASGSITIVSPVSGNYIYSFDNGVSFQVSNVKSNLGAGTYYVKVQNNANGCMSPVVAATISTAVGMNPPTLSIIQPTCGNLFGSITVTSPISGVQYSFDNGVSFQISNIKNGLTAGTYYVKVRDNVTNCVSSATTAIISSGGSFNPTVSVTQPTCGNAFGTITFTSPIGANYSYSFDGGATFGPSPTRTGLAPGTYRMCARDNNTNCISSEITVIINAAIGGAVTPIVTITQPTCTLGGTIAITNLPVGASTRLMSTTYSLENFYDWALNKATYTNLKAGSYEIKIRTSCGEASKFVTLNPAPAYYFSTKCYAFINVNSSKALTVANMSMADFGALTQTTFTGNGAGNQQWQLLDAGNAFAKFISRTSHKAMTNAQVTEGSNVYQLTYAAGGASDWDIECVGDGYVRIVHRLSGKYLSIENNSANENANVVIRSNNSSNSSVYWRIVEVICMTGLDLQGSNSTLNETQQGFKTKTPAMNFSDNESLPFETGKSGKGKIQDVRLFPNPAKNYIDLELKDLPENDITVTLFNVLGSRSFETQSHATQSLRLDTQNLPNGMYILQVSEKGKAVIRKEVVIQK